MRIYHSTEETLSADTFLSVLRADYESVFLTDCIIEGSVIFSTPAAVDPMPDDNVENRQVLHPLAVVDKDIICIGCTFKNAVRFEKIDFQKEVFFANTTFKETVRFSDNVFQAHCEFAESTFEGPASFQRAQFHGKANFRQTCFEQIADFNAAQFLENVVFRNSVFKDIARFKAVLFMKGLDLAHGRFSETTLFNRSRFHGKIDLTSARFAVAAAYKDINYIDNTVRQWFRSKWAKRAETPTDFYLNSEDINEVLNPFFKRHVADQQFIRAFKEQHPFWGQVWRWSSDYGRSLALWALWSLLIATFFAFLYMLPTSWFPKGLHNWTPQFHQVSGTDAGLPLTFWKSFYFSIVTFTTLGFGDVVADNTLARIFVTLEVIFGYIMLGGLISIFANKLASRS